MYEKLITNARREIDSMIENANFMIDKLSIVPYHKNKQNSIDCQNSRLSVLLQCKKLMSDDTENKKKI